MKIIYPVAVDVLNNPSSSKVQKQLAKGVIDKIDIEILAATVLAKNKSASVTMKLARYIMDKKGKN